jgi:hypothetical protein
MHTHPKWKYHASLPSQVVDSQEAEDALGDDWYDTPAEAKERSEDKKAKPSAGEGGDEITEEERLGLLELARSMGLNPHHRLGADKLLALIQEERDRKAAEGKTE